MKVNKNTIFALAVLCIVTGTIAFYLMYNEQDAAGSILASVFTGCIVSIVIALVGYYHEKGRINRNVESNIRSLYINMRTLQEITGDTLGKIAISPDLSELRFKDINSFCALNLDLYNRMDLSAYSSFISRSTKAIAYEDFQQFSNQLYNLKDVASKLEVAMLKYTLLVKELGIKQMQGQSIAMQEIELERSTKNSINIRTAKLHEYQTSLIIQLDNLASRCYKKTRKNPSWKEMKALLENETANILSSD